MAASAVKPEICLFNENIWLARKSGAQIIENVAVKAVMQ
jgi:hypothetical protein